MDPDSTSLMILHCHADVKNFKKEGNYLTSAFFVILQSDVVSNVAAPLSAVHLFFFQHRDRMKIDKLSGFIEIVADTTLSSKYIGQNNPSPGESYLSNVF